MFEKKLPHLMQTTMGKNGRCREWSSTIMGVSFAAIIIAVFYTAFSLLAENQVLVGLDSKNVTASYAFRESCSPRLDSNANSIAQAPIGSTLAATELETASEFEVRIVDRDKESTPEVNVHHDDIYSGPINTTASPFEARHPGQELPWWAKKMAGMQMLSVPVDNEICFVHVGKTAGSSMGCALGFNYDCPEASCVNGVLPLHTTHVFHNSMNDCPVNVSNYLISVRNPFERIKSAHFWERQIKHGSNSWGRGQAMIYGQCNFETLNDLAENGLTKNGNASALCKERAHSHIRGTEQYGFHTFHNYQYYYRNLDMHASTRIFVVRTEHVVYDWNAIEFVLGGMGHVTLELQDGHHSEMYSVPGDDFLTDQSRRVLCETLCEEIQMYKQLLRGAANLDPGDVSISLNELSSSCPREARSSNCFLDGERKVNSKLLKTPYELRFPGTKLPYWAKKNKQLRDNKIARDKEICFVHVGKTGGTTMASALGFTNYAPEAPYINSMLSRRTQHVFHNAFNDCPFNVSIYLVSVRDPLKRINSAFVYERPKSPAFRRGRGQGKIHEECPFRTLNDLAEQGLAKSGNASDLCKQRAFDHIRGIEQFGFHAFYNYQYYYTDMEINESTRIFVVRTEHLREDWNMIERMLGGETESVQEFDRVNPSTDLSIPGDDSISETSRRLLCAALCKEIQIYKKLLISAVNLNETDVQVSNKELAVTCPLEASLDTCVGDT